MHEADPSIRGRVVTSRADPSCSSYLRPNQDYFPASLFNVITNFGSEKTYAYMDRVRVYIRRRSPVRFVFDLASKTNIPIDDWSKRHARVFAVCGKVDPMYGRTCVAK